MESVIYKKISAPKISCAWSVMDGKDIEFYKLADEYYREQHFKPGNLRPRKNLLENIRFEFEDNPLDIYDLHKEFNIPTSFLISNKLAEILREFNLQEHVMFSGVTYTLDGEERHDMHFLYLYNYMDESIDFKRSKFWALDSKSLEEGKLSSNINPDDILEDNVKMEEFDDFNRQSFYKEDLTEGKIMIKSLRSPIISQLDFFTFRYINKGVYISPDLASKVEENKIKGLQYLNDYSFPIIRE